MKVENISIITCKQVYNLKLKLHPDAIKNFNKKADNLLSKLAPTHPKSFNSKDSFRPDFSISGSFRKKDDQIIVESKDCFKHNDQFISLKGCFKEIEQLSRNMLKTKTLSEMVSITLLINLISDWMKDKYKNVTDESMVDYVLSKSEASIQELEIWIPIAELYIKSEIKIGKVTLKTIKEEMFESWRTVIKNTNPADNDKIQKFDEEQEKIHGLAAATMKVNAEPIRAFEIALEETEKSIELLRFFSPINFDPEKTSRCVVFGKENLESTKHLVMENGNLIQISKAIVDKNIQPWVIDDVNISLFKNCGFEILSNILAREDKNRKEFQQRLLSSLKWYSNSSLMKNPSDKLVYIFVALESLLLRGKDEPIQNIMGDAMAFLIGSNRDERLSIVKNLKDAYSLRSTFVHHGKPIKDFKDLETLKEFMKNAWMFFNFLIQNAEHFENIDQLFQKIENIKYS